MSAFSLNISRIVRSSKVSLEQTVARFVFGMFARIIMRSPVDTGRFRANWVLSFDDASEVTVEREDKGVVTTNGSGNSTVKSEIEGILIGSTSWIGKKAYLVNNLPYGKYLEYGTPLGGPISQQAPQGMVRLTVNEYADVLDQAKPYAL